MKYSHVFTGVRSHRTCVARTELLLHRTKEQIRHAHELIDNSEALTRKNVRRSSEQHRDGLESGCRNNSVAAQGEKPSQFVFELIYIERLQRKVIDSGAESRPQIL